MAVGIPLQSGGPLPASAEQEDWVAEFYLYTDESGKLQSSDYTSFCGYVAHTSEWQRLARVWTDSRFKWGIPPIHMAEIMHPDRRPGGDWAKKKAEWGALWEEKRDAMLEEFADIIRYSHAVCVGNVVDAAHFKKMPDSPFKKVMDNPIYLSFYNTIRDSLDKIDRAMSSEHNLSVVMDDDEEFAMKCYQYLNQVRKAFPHEVGKRIDAICFGNDKAYPGIQAADMVAYESRSFMVARQKDKDLVPSGLYALLTRGGMHQPTLYTAEFLDLHAKTWVPPAQP